MRVQISNTNMIVIKAFIIVVFALFASFYFVYLLLTGNFNRVVLITIILFLSFSTFIYYFLAGRFFKIEMDEEYFYYKGNFKSGKINKQDLIQVNASYFPYRMFLSWAYVVTLIFKTSSHEKRIIFLSQEVPIFSNAAKIKYFKSLQSIAKTNSRNYDHDPR